MGKHRSDYQGARSAKGGLLSLRNQKGRANSRAFLGDFSNYTRKGTPKHRNGQRSIVTVSVLVVCAVASVLVAVDYWANYGRIYQGVSVEGVSLGGNTPEEARGVVEESVAGSFEEIRLTGAGEEFALTADEMGVDFDVPAAVEEAYAFGRRGGVLERLGNRLETGWGTVRIPPATENDPERLSAALSEVYDAIKVEPVEAGFEMDEDGVYVTRSRPGQEVDEEKLLEDLEAGLLEGKREYEIPVVAVEPELTSNEAEGLKPTKLIGTYRTDYTLSSDKSAERVENLKIASGAISGQVLAPGEVFSVNAVAEPLEYYESKVIIEGREELADGGGLCQVSSTLFMAANYAGLEIVERNPHYAELPYIRPGLDATVWFGALDMKFQNTTDGYVLLREYVADDGYVYAEVWGQPQDVEVEMDSEPVYLGSDSAEWVTSKKVTENGKVVFDEAIYNDTYLPLVDENGELIPPDSVEPAPVLY